MADGGAALAIAAAIASAASAAPAGAAGAEVEALVKKVYGTPQAIVEKAVVAAKGK